MLHVVNAMDPWACVQATEERPEIATARHGGEEIDGAEPVVLGYRLEQAEAKRGTAYATP
jgi:hypothetical protein